MGLDGALARYGVRRSADFSRFSSELAVLVAGCAAVYEAGPRHGGVVEAALGGGACRSARMASAYLYLLVYVCATAVPRRVRRVARGLQPCGMDGRWCTR